MNKNRHFYFTTLFIENSEESSKYKMSGSTIGTSGTDLL